VNRLYTLLFAFLPKKWQDKLWNHLTSEYGYVAVFRFGNGTAYVCDTQEWEDISIDPYEEEEESDGAV